MSNSSFKTPIFKKLLKDAPHIEKEREIFNKKYTSFITQDNAQVGVILRCHLIIEHFLDQYLSAANPAIKNWDEARLTFTQKLTLIEHPKSSLNMLLPGLRSLNALRNRLAHRLDATFDEKLIKPIYDFLKIWNGAAKKPIPSGIKLIEEFTLQASGWLNSNASMITRHASGYGLLGFFSWSNQPEED